MANRRFSLALIKSRYRTLQRQHFTPIDVNTWARSRTSLIIQP